MYVYGIFDPFYCLPGKNCFEELVFWGCFLTAILRVWHKCSKPISRYSTALNIAVFPVKWQYERGILFTNTVAFQNVTPTSSHYLRTDVWSSGWNVALSQRDARVQSGISHIKPSALSLKWNKAMYAHMKALAREHKHKCQCMKPEASCSSCSTSSTIWEQCHHCYCHLSLWLTSIDFLVADVNGNILRVVWQIW